MKKAVYFLFILFSIQVNAQNLNAFLYTEKAKELLKQRFENGYVAGTGFSDDITKTINDATSFGQNPSEFRPILGETSFVPSGGQTLHTSAIYAYAIDNVNLANTVADEILAIVNTNNLYTTYWEESNTKRWDADNDLWIQTAKVKKLKDSFYFIKNLQNSLTTIDKITIEDWFKRYKELAEKTFCCAREYMGNYWSYYH